MGIRRRNSNRNERGTTMAEFALIASVFFMIIFAIIEFGRLLYTHNALTDAARRGARYAAVHKESKKLCARNVVIYGESNVNPTSCAATGSPLINGLTLSNVTVDYVGADTDNDPNTPATSYGSNLGTATVTITNYTFTLSIPFARQALTMPPYTTTLTAESAGEEPTPMATP
ncbi:MAG TPA: TadE family protein [Pyrinomonadaceae bacterium]|nr:TadE family protein [Pyrinomonadaceae bacterium]